METVEDRDNELEPPIRSAGGKGGRKGCQVPFLAAL